MSSVYRVDAYVGDEKITTPVFFEREIHAVTYAFDRAMMHADGDASEVKEVYGPLPGDTLPYRYLAQQWSESLIGDGPIRGDLLEMIVTRVGVHDEPVDLPA